MTRASERPLTAPLLVIAAGGTGGHMFPAQALAEEMLARGWRVRLATDARGARYAAGFPPEVERRATPAATFAQGSWLTRVTAPFAIAAGVAATWRDFRRERPACVAGFGGYPALPAMVAAGLLEVPTLIHEQNGVLGRVNRRFAPKVDVVACGIWPTAVPEGARALHVGNPVRGAVLDREGATYIEPGDHPMGLLVIGGSQGAGVFARVVPEALGLLAPGAPRAAPAQPAGAPRGHGPGAGGLRAHGARGRAARLLRRRARAAGRGDARHQPRRRELDRRHQRHRAAGDPRSPIRTPWTTTRRRTPPGWFPPAGRS